MEEEKKEEVAIVDDTKLKIKVLEPKKTPKSKKKKTDTVKIDLKKLKENASTEQESSDIPNDERTETLERVETEVRGTGSEQVTEESKKEEKEVTPILEITSEEAKKDFKPREDLEETRETLDLPENVEKLVSFINETGGTVEDYARLNADYSSIDEDLLLREYYMKNKPHLTEDEVDFIIEDNFVYDEDMDEERDITKKRLAKKEEVAKAKGYLENLKSKYYAEIKNKSGLSQEQKDAVDFFTKYNEEQQVASRNHEIFKQSTQDFFNSEFKGFDFNVGEKKFRYSVKNQNEVATAQSDIATFIKKFLNEDGSVRDYDGYHKAIYAARNADTIAQHFYEQGKADAVKDVVAKSKNINNTARSSAPNDSVLFNGMRITGVSGMDSSKLKIKTKK